MARSELRTKVISLKVLPRDYRALELYADSKGVSVSTLCYLFVKQELADTLRSDSPLNKPLFQGVLGDL